MEKSIFFVVNQIFFHNEGKTQSYGPPILFYLTPDWKLGHFWLW